MDIIEEYLEENERILWKGSIDVKLIYPNFMDIGLFIFRVLLTIYLSIFMPIFITILFKVKVPIFFVVFFILFLTIFITNGTIIYYLFRYIIEKNTNYIVTDKRVFLIRNKNLQYHYIRRLRNINLINVNIKSGVGTIAFHNNNPLMRKPISPIKAIKEEIMPFIKSETEFFKYAEMKNIKDVENIYKLIKEINNKI